MQIELNKVGKQYNGEWIFKSISLSFTPENQYWISGHNGSGKSSLLRIIAGYNLPSKGTIKWKSTKQELIAEEVYQEVALCSPALTLFDNHTVEEAIAFHFKNQELTPEMNQSKVLKFCYLEESKSKTIQQLSSGMLQRLKLALAFLSRTELLLLDEPCANLDAQAIQWYQKNLQLYKKDRLLIICSNNKEEEHFLCNKTINLEDFKE